MESSDRSESEAVQDGALDAAEVASRPEPWHFWRALLGAIVVQEGLNWTLDAIPPRTGESTVLRWLRALGEHPFRGPLGLTLACLGCAQLVRALLNRRTRG